MNKKHIAILAMLACLHSPALWAQAAGAAAPATPSDTAAAQPAEPDTLILSDTLHYDDIRRESTFTGNVVLTRGNMTLNADKLVTREDADGHQFGTATAEKTGLVHIRQENPENFETIRARGVRAEYDGKVETITLIGQAVITRYICGKTFDNLRGERIIYHQKTGVYEAFGGANSAGEGGRVRSLIQPRSRVDQAIAECRKAAGQKAAGQ
uniref:lipopolysaccharide transport periplasmic protein LptA n=1 Tax=Castellaniella defragrans TaxID=75697 RepID=UPI00333F1D19